MVDPAKKRNVVFTVSVLSYHAPKVQWEIYFTIVYTKFPDGKTEDKLSEKSKDKLSEKIEDKLSEKTYVLCTEHKSWYII